MTLIEKSIVVAAPPDIVFAYVVAAWEGRMGFFSGVSAWRAISPPPMGDGYRVRYKALTPGIKTVVEAEIRDFRPGEGWRVVAVSGAELCGEWRFAACPGGTRIGHRMEFHLPLGWLGRLVGRLVATPKWHFLVGRSMRHLKQAIEREVAEANPALVKPPG